MIFYLQTNKSGKPSELISRNDKRINFRRILGTLALILGRQDERIDLIRPQFQNENFLKKSVTFNNFHL